MKTSATMPQVKIMMLTPYLEDSLEETGCATGFMYTN